MTIFKHTLIAILILALSIVPGQSFAFGKKSPKVVFILVLDDSGAFGSMTAKADEKKIQLLKLYTTLKKRKKTRHAVIDIISTSTGESEMVTQPKKLEADWKRIKAYVNGKPARCNNLADTFRTLDSTIREYDEEGFEEINVHIFSSFIDVPAPCNQVTNLILPQQPPLVDLNFDGKSDLETILTRSPKVKSILIFGVKAEQYDPWHKVIYPKEWVKKDPTHIFRMKKFSKTGLALEKGLHVGRD